MDETQKDRWMQPVTLTERFWRLLYKERPRLIMYMLEAEKSKRWTYLKDQGWCIVFKSGNDLRISFVIQTGDSLPDVDRQVSGEANIIVLDCLRSDRSLYFRYNNGHNDGINLVSSIFDDSGNLKPDTVTEAIYAPAKVEADPADPYAPIPAPAELNEDQRAIWDIFEAQKVKVLKKNSDYGSSVFKQPVLSPGMDAGAAILVRAGDKIERIRSLQQRGQLVADESLKDTVGDLGAYAFLYLIYLERKGKDKA